MLPFIDLPPEAPAPAPFIQWDGPERSLPFPNRIVLAQASQAELPKGAVRAVGACKPIEIKADSIGSSDNDVAPLGPVWRTLTVIEHNQIDDSLLDTAKVTVLEAPTRGVLSPYSGGASFSYLPNDHSYEGPDRATALVEVGGYKVKVVYHFVLMQDVPGSGAEGDPEGHEDICPNGGLWKISNTPKANGSITRE